MGKNEKNLKIKSLNYRTKITNDEGEAILEFDDLRDGSVYDIYLAATSV